jgi:hypothetical protein
MTERNRNGLVPGQAVDFATIQRVERQRRQAVREAAGAASAAPVDLSQPWFAVRRDVERATGVRPKNKTHARELLGASDAGETSEEA